MNPTAFAFSFMMLQAEQQLAQKTPAKVQTLADLQTLAKAEAKRSRKRSKALVQAR